MKATDDGEFGAQAPFELLDGLGGRVAVAWLDIGPKANAIGRRGIGSARAGKARQARKGQRGNDCGSGE